MERILILRRGNTIREINGFLFEIEKGDTFIVAETLFRIRAPENATINGYTQNGPVVSGRK